MNVLASSIIQVTMSGCQLFVSSSSKAIIQRIGVAERFTASIFAMQKLTWRRFESQQAKKEKSLDSQSFPLNPRSGHCPIFRSCFDATNVWSDHMSRASNATKKCLQEFHNHFDLHSIVKYWLGSSPSSPLLVNLLTKLSSCPSKIVFQRNSGRILTTYRPMHLKKIRPWRNEMWKKLSPLW